MRAGDRRLVQVDVLWLLHLGRLLLLLLLLLVVVFTLIIVVSHWCSPLETAGPGPRDINQFVILLLRLLSTMLWSVLVGRNS